MQRFLILSVLLALVPGCGGGGGGSASRVPPAPADTTVKDNLVIAEVGDIQITGTDLKNYMSDRSGNQNLDRHMQNPDILQIGLSSFVDQLVWAEMARRSGLQLSHEDAMKVASYESQLLATRYVAEVVQTAAMPSRERVEEFYRENQERFLAPARVGIRHILVDSQGEAETLLGQLRSGADFGELARRHSKDEASRDVGGAVGFVERGKSTPGIGKDPEFERAVLPLEVGELTVVRSAKGWHVVRADEREGGGLIPLEEVYEDLSKNLTTEDWSRVYNEHLSAARAEIGAQYVTENFNKFSGTADNPGRLYRAAGQTTDPVARIELYRRLSFDFPDAKQAPEAMFMMGYIYLTDLRIRKEAESAFVLTGERFPGTPWAKAAAWMLDHLDEENPKELGSPREIVGKAVGGR